MPVRFLAVRSLAVCLMFFLLLLTACSQRPQPSVEEAPAGLPAISSSLQGLTDQALADSYARIKLQELCDTVGSRLVGSAGMKRAIAWSQEAMWAAGLDSVWLEPVTTQGWTRGQESAHLLAPIAAELEMVGIGLSVGTGSEGNPCVEGEVVAVRDFEEMESRADEIAGKIILFNPPWKGYGPNVQYRVHGASRAAALGAVACLVRSVTGNSLGTPHTGMLWYDEDQPRIPAAALTVEDAAWLHRLCQEGLRPRIKLMMEAECHGEITSYNVVGELRGRDRPEEIILLGGHLDSWDVGPCAHDNAAGAVMTLAAVELLATQDVKPRRTIRLVHFTSEELGGQGGLAYLEAHRVELPRHLLALESDSGAFAPRGFSVAADSTIVEWLADLASPLAGLAPADWQVKAGGSGVDTGPLVRAGVTGVGHRVEHTGYFDVHHSRADTFEKIDLDQLAANVAVIAGLIHLVADLPADLPWAVEAEAADAP